MGSESIKLQPQFQHCRRTAIACEPRNRAPQDGVWPPSRGDSPDSPAVPLWLVGSS